MSQLKVNSIVDASGGSNAQLYGVASPPNSMGFRNRIINGDMRIDQRNAGASVTIAVSQTYSVDRWKGFAAPASKYSVQQNAGAVTPPAGFKNYVGATSLSAYSVAAGDYEALSQVIEGYNVADLGWGTPNAQTVTLSFWVRSSLTGTFGGSLLNAASVNRSYPFTYTINSANTWEYKTITIAGDQSGTWATDNTGSIAVNFGLGVGSNFSGTAGAWNGNFNFSATGAVSVVGTNGATFYITGVQLEAGTVASPFERRDYGRELMMCQRYYAKSYNTDVVPGTANAFGGGLAANSSGTVVGSVATSIFFPVEMRPTPTITFYSLVSGATGVWRDSGSATDKAVATYASTGTRGTSLYNTATWSSASGVAYGHWVASSEL